MKTIKVITFEGIQVMKFRVEGRIMVDNYIQVFSTDRVIYDGDIVEIHCKRA